LATLSATHSLPNGNFFRSASDTFLDVFASQSSDGLSPSPISSSNKRSRQDPIDESDSDREYDPTQLDLNLDHEADRSMDVTHGRLIKPLRRPAKSRNDALSAPVIFPSSPNTLQEDDWSLALGGVSPITPMTISTD
jgi:hypothetical protein